MLWVMFGEERLHPSTEMPPFAGFSLQRKRRQEEAASTGPGAQKCSVSPSSTQSPELGHSCLVLLTQPSKPSPAAHRNDVRHHLNPQCLQLAVYGALCCLSSSPDLMGSPLNRAVPKVSPTARQSRGTAGASPSQQRLFQSPLPGFDLRSLGEFSLRKKQVLLNAWPGELERSQQESQKPALLGFGGLGPPAARADGFIPDPQGPQGTKSFGNTNPRVLQLPPHPRRSREHMASTRLLV